MNYSVLDPEVNQQSVYTDTVEMHIYLLVFLNINVKMRRIQQKCYDPQGVKLFLFNAEAFNPLISLSND